MYLPGRAYTPRGRLVSLAEEQIGGSSRAKRMEKKEKREEEEEGEHPVEASSRPTWPHVGLD